ncbi:MULTISPECIES: hypothetical protein [unclassified Lysobacter]|nr:hypothetical protein [Lysobacter sp. MMG2]
MKRFGSSRPTACPVDRGRDWSERENAAHAASRQIAPANSPY